MWLVSRGVRLVAIFGTSCVCVIPRDDHLGSIAVLSSGVGRLVGHLVRDVRLFWDVHELSVADVPALVRASVEDRSVHIVVVPGRLL